MAPAVFKTDVTRYPGQAGSIPVRLRKRFFPGNSVSSAGARVILQVAAPVPSSSDERLEMARRRRPARPRLTQPLVREDGARPYQRRFTLDRRGLPQ